MVSSIGPSRREAAAFTHKTAELLAWLSGEKQELWILILAGAKAQLSLRPRSHRLKPVLPRLKAGADAGP